MEVGSAYSVYNMLRAFHNTAVTPSALAMELLQSYTKPPMCIATDLYRHGFEIK